jgi:coenzyme F420-0:L-glutamate ligase / coenzyme F420-1:gamma-L-glutamate ligase
VQISITGITRIPEVQPGDDLTALLLEGARASGVAFEQGDVLVVTQKIVSKAEGRLVDLREVEPSDLARRYGEAWGKDPRQIEVVFRESRRIVRMERGLVISETHHGFVCANAGVDASNVPGEHIVALLPADPDASALRLREEIQGATGVDVPVIISDSFGRPWRNGITNVAIGIAGLEPLIDYRGRYDEYGYLLSATIIAIADELSSAAELVMGKLDAAPAALVRGYPFTPAEGRGRDMVMDPSRDLFR